MPVNAIKNIQNLVSPRLMPLVLACLVLIGGLSTTYVLWHQAQQQQAMQLRNTFEFASTQVTSNIISRINNYIVVMRGIQGFIHGSELVTKNEFTTYIQGLQLQEKLPGVQGVGLIKMVLHADKNKHITEMRHQGNAVYKINPDAERERYAPITQMEPLTKENFKVIGLDVLTVPAAALAMQQALALNDVTITSRITLVQDAGKNDVFGFVMYLPLYKNTTNLNTLPDRQAAIAGWVDVPFRIQDLITSLQNEIDPDIDLEIHDGEPQLADSLMYHSDHVSHQKRLADGRQQLSRIIEIGGRQWTLLLSTTPAFEARATSGHQTTLLGLTGIALTLTLSLLTWLLSIGKENAQTRFQQLFNQASDGILIMNRDYRFVDANNATLALLGYTRDELFKLHLPDILTKQELPRLHRVLSNIMSGTPNRDEWTHVRSDGSEFPVEVSTHKLDNERFFAILHDLTEHKKNEQMIKDSEARYKLLFTANPVPMWVYDINTLAFIAVNNAAIVQYGYTNEEFIGMKISDVRPKDDLQHLQDNIKETAGKTDLYNQAGIWQHRKKDGSLIWVDITCHTLTFEGRAAEIVLAQDVTARVEAERQLHISAKVFESSHEGLIITDANTLILSANRAYSEMTGYSLKELIGNTPTLSKSKVQNKEFYKSMWASLNHDHHWQGEIWNQRKSGEVYPVWLSITAVIDEAVKVSNYIASFSDISQSKKAEETIHNLAYYDVLTGLSNRQLLRERLKQIVSFDSEQQHQGAILHIDLDDFKSLNDTKGHDVGDQLLIEVAKRIRSCTYPDDTVARLGSDEFVVMLDLLNMEQEQATREVEKIAERIHNAIKQPFDLGGSEYHCTSCIGINIFRNDKTSIEEILRKADAAMFQAKKSGRNKIHFFDAKMQAALEQRVKLESMLHNAIPDQFVLHYQMQVDDTGKIFGAEALIRWQHPEQGLIPPAVFIPLAEETGLILPIGHWVLETACKQLKAWDHHLKTKHLQLAVNVSAKQFHQPDFVEQVLEVLELTGAEPTRLKLELTESLLVENVDTVIQKMTQLKAKGVHFSLDDFGTGFSSLSYLKQLPIDQLKIDQSFVRDILNDPNDASIVRTIITLGESLGLSVIAEGVETEAQRKFLITNGCHNYQGYLFSRPVPVSEFEHLVLQQS
ncbi:MAG: EAL domain-containing protein [Methylotenera sp.]|nr:EAL domain-containing protein [Methylotenera sp.]